MSSRRDRDPRDDRDRRRGDRGGREEPVPAPPRERPRPSNKRQDALNEFFVSGEGIHREVLQREICKYLGPEAYSRPSTYNVWRRACSRRECLTDFHSGE